MSNRKNNITIESILNKYKTVLKTDLEVYRNHVYRVYNLSINIDKDQCNNKKYAIVASYHDIGIWTDSFDYLDPSIKLAKEYLIQNDHQEWIEEISLMIENHHKMSSYEGEYVKTVETFRKADWIDVTMGIKLFGINKSLYKTICSLYTIQGFHWFLVSQSIRYFIKHPLNPLPMFKK